VLAVLRSALRPMIRPTACINIHRRGAPTHPVAAYRACNWSAGSRAMGSSPAGPALAGVALACQAFDVPGGHVEKVRGPRRHGCTGSRDEASLPSLRPGKSLPDSRSRSASPFSPARSSRPRAAGPRRSTPISSTSTKPLRAATSPPGKSPSCSVRRSGRHSSRCDSWDGVRLVGRRPAVASRRLRNRQSTICSPP
jgi:hypothetical protein